jgi:hypothetical protein
MKTALDDRGLEWLYVVYPGEEWFPLHERIDAAGLRSFVARRLECTERDA